MRLLVVEFPTLGIDQCLDSIFFKTVVNEQHFKEDADSSAIYTSPIDYSAIYASPSNRFLWEELSDHDIKTGIINISGDYALRQKRGISFFFNSVRGVAFPEFLSHSDALLGYVCLPEKTTHEKCVKDIKMSTLQTFCAKEWTFEFEPDVLLLGMPLFEPDDMDVQLLADYISMDLFNEFRPANLVVLFKDGVLYSGDSLNEKKLLEKADIYHIFLQGSI